MNELVIVGRFPFHGRRLEGMVQRIASIDAQLALRPRTYLDLYAFKRLRSSSVTVANTQVFTGSFLHFWTILQTLRKARTIYVHSIYFYALILLPLIFTNRRVRVILDMHGTVPEEIAHAGNPLQSLVMGWVERLAFGRISLAICVTKRMEEYYRAKYLKSCTSFLYLPIFTSQVCQTADACDVSALRSQLDIPKNSTVFLYSGGLQPWQNVDLMLTAAKSLLNSEYNWMIFLTGETDGLNRRISEIFDRAPDRLIVTHVSPNELRNYYELADFGFLLREDHILNRVANPTKLVEYLYFGMTPIVWSADVGDFLAMGYEYVNIDGIIDRRPFAQKSARNRQIGLRLLADAKAANLSEHI